MKLNRLSRMLSLLTLAPCLACHAAEAATLKVGDPAPLLRASEWVQGEPVKAFEPDKVYLVEFWATWCGPCRDSIPHLSELHAKFNKKGLVVIGQDVMEQDPDVVKPFVKKMGDKMTYRVALDSEAGDMEKNWMHAAGQEGIPTAFIVDQRGIVAWIGHPMALKDELIEQVLAGKFDVAKAAGDYAKAFRIDEQTRALWSEFNRHVQKGEWDQAESKLDEVVKLLPEDKRDNLGPRRFQLLLNRQDYKRAYQLALQLSDAHPDDATLQNAIAWIIATREGIGERDLDIAEKLARRATAAAGKDSFMLAEALDTLARVLFLKGKKSDAIAQQKLAVNHAEGGRKANFQRNLDDYKAGRVPSEARIAELQREIARNLQKKDWAKAESTLAELEKLVPDNERAGLGSHRFHILVGRGDYEGASQLIERLSDGLPGNAMVFNQLAWGIAIADDSTRKDLELAEKVARRANDATKNMNAEILDTLARVLFAKGQKESAVELQQQAVASAKGQRKRQFQETLDSYKDGKQPKAY